MVGSPPDTITTSSLPFSRDSRASTLAITSATGTIPAWSGEESAKHVGQRRLQPWITSSSSTHVCWVCISGSPPR